MRSLDATYGSLGLMNLAPALIWGAQGYYAMSAIFLVGSVFFFIMAGRPRDDAAPQDPTQLATKADINLAIAKLKTEMLLWSIGLAFLVYGFVVPFLFFALKH
jgi:hypothetical protein